VSKKRRGVPLTSRLCCSVATAGPWGIRQPDEATGAAVARTGAVRGDRGAALLALDEQPAPTTVRASNATKQ
jgi:hypothetical protein